MHQKEFIEGVAWGVGLDEIGNAGFDQMNMSVLVNSTFCVGETYSDVRR